MRYSLDGKVVDTEKAAATWTEARDHDGRNFISRATSDQWEHQTLHRSRSGWYYLEYWSDWQSSRSTVHRVSDKEAARWLLLMDETLPDDLVKFENELLV